MHFNNVSKIVDVRLDGEHLGVYKLNAITCREWCPEEPEEAEIVQESAHRLWSNATMWTESNMTVPVNGSEVVIPAAWRILLDVNSTVFMNKLEVFGTLIVNNSKKFETAINAEIMYFHGGEIIPGSEQVLNGSVLLDENITFTTDLHLNC